MSRYATELETYYSARASEYERTTGYIAANDAAVAAQLRARYQLALEDKDVLEIACGPGYWTEAVALTARSVCATDLDATLVSMTQQRLIEFANVTCQVSNAYTLGSVSGPFNAAFANFWWSHISKSRITEFLTVLHTKLMPGSLVMFMDDLPYYHRRPRTLDDEGNQIEQRALENGDCFMIIKNFPSRREIQNALHGIATQIEYKEFIADGYWTLTYHTLLS